MDWWKFVQLAKNSWPTANCQGLGFLAFVLIDFWCFHCFRLRNLHDLQDAFFLNGQMLALLFTFQSSFLKRTTFFYVCVFTYHHSSVGLGISNVPELDSYCDSTFFNHNGLTFLKMFALHVLLEEKRGGGREREREKERGTNTQRLSHTVKMSGSSFKPKNSIHVCLA